MSGSGELCIQISTPTTPRHHRDEELPMPNARICRTVCTDQQLVNSSNIEDLRIYRTVDTNRPRANYNGSGNPFLRPPKMIDFKRQFVKIVHIHQNVEEIHNAEALICERVTEILTMS